MSNPELSIFGWAALFVAQICELRTIKTANKNWRNHYACNQSQKVK